MNDDSAAMRTAKMAAREAAAAQDRIDRMQRAFGWLLGAVAVIGLGAGILIGKLL